MTKHRKRHGEPAVRAELPKGTWCVRTKGKVYCYHQPGRGSKNPGQRMRVPYTPDDPRFWAWHAEQGLWGVPDGGTLEAVVEEWLASPTFSGKAAATQHVYTRFAEQMIERWGTRAIGSVVRTDVLDWRREMEATPTTANLAVSIAASFWKWAVDANLAPANPAKGIERYETNPEQADPWPQWALDLVAEHGSWELRAFVALGHYTGQRTADIAAMSLRDVEQGEIRVAIQKKRHRSTVWVPLHPALDRLIAEARRRGFIYLIPRADGSKRDAASLRNLFWRGVRRPGPLHAIHEAGLSPHGLRALAVNTLLEAGCSTAEVAAITDQSLAIVERYARQRDQRRLARQAMAKWRKAEEGTDQE